MSNRLKELVKTVQLKKQWTSAQVAESIGYSRVHLTRLYKEPDTADIEDLLTTAHPGVFQKETSVVRVPHHGNSQKNSPAESEDSYRAKYIKRLERENELLEELVRSNQEIIKTNLTLVLAMVRTISVRQLGTGNVALKSLERLEKSAGLKTASLVKEADKEIGQIEREAYSHDNASAVGS